MGCSQNTKAGSARGKWIRKTRRRKRSEDKEKLRRTWRPWKEYG